jgi:DNA polymerase III delta prime subunit
MVPHKPIVAHGILHKAIISQNSPNILIYGSAHADKYSEVFRTICSHYQLKDFNENTEHEVSYKSSKHYHEFNMGQIRHSNLLTFWELILDLSSRENYFGIRAKNVILIRNFNNIKDTIQAKWRGFLEKFQKTTRFIFLTDNFTSVIGPIRSRFLCIRTPETTSLWADSKSPQEIICTQILKIYEHDFRDIRQCDIQKIKDITYNLLKYSVDIQGFYRELTKQCLRNPRWIHSIKYKMLSAIVASEKGLKQSYRLIIHIESLLLNLYYLSSFAHYEIDRNEEEGVHVLHDAAGPYKDQED